MAHKGSPFLLCVMDGIGLNPESRGNALKLAKAPHLHRLFSTYPFSTLITYGERVGLPAGQMGNSEVGHLNIGAGRVIEQWLLRIDNALKGDFLDTSPEYQNWCRESKSSPHLHVIGLYSDGGVHSHSDHLMLLLEKLSKDVKGFIYLHLITDGRDTSPHRALEQIPELESKIKQFANCQIASVCGRFYAMDRDKRWERTKKSYDLIARGQGAKGSQVQEYIRKSYESGVSDEFLEPLSLISKPIEADDAVIFWNFREDRMRQLVAALCVDSFQGFTREAPLFEHKRCLCFTEYDHTFHLPALFEQLIIKNHFGEVLSQQQYSQLRVAETEKYPHVTYFFNGGIETPYPGEERKLVPSPREVKTYDLKPEMSAYPVTEIVCEALSTHSSDVVIVNLANCDMVGHTGVLEAGIKAVETVDACVGKMVAALEAHGGTGIFIADHGNAEQMINYTDGSPHTSHTTYPVPMVVVGRGNSFSLLSDGALCDVAPTALELLGIPQPLEMTGRSLIKKNN